MGKLVKAHPAYSGTIMTSTYQIARDLGWEYFEKLAKQKVMQVQSSVDPPNKLALGERAAMADGNDFNVDPAQGAGPAGRDRLSDRGRAADRVPERRAEDRAQSERGAAVPELPVLARGPAAAVRLRRAALRASAGQAEAGAAGARGHQGDEGRSGRGRGAGGARSRRAITKILQRVMMESALHAGRTSDLE